MKHLIRTVLYVLPLALAAQTPTFRLTEGFLQKKDFEGTIEYAKTAVISLKRKDGLHTSPRPDSTFSAAYSTKTANL